MCGIAGIYVKEPYIGRFPVDRFLDYLFLGIESRGKHASGYLAVTKKNKVATQKEPSPASKFVLERRAVPKDTKMALIHTRWATQGHQSVNENNHPVQFGTCYAVHNGHIHNDDAVFNELELERPARAEVDSVAIPACLSYDGMGNPDDIKQALERLQGGMAIAAVDPKNHPGQLILAKGQSSPLIILNHPKVIVWASSKTAIELAWGSIIGTPPSKKANAFKQEWDGMMDVSYGYFFIIKDDEFERHSFSPKTYTRSYSGPSAFNFNNTDDDWGAENYTPYSSGDEKDEDWFKNEHGIWCKRRADGTISVSAMPQPTLDRIAWTCQKPDGSFSDNEFCIFDCESCDSGLTCRCWVWKTTGKASSHPPFKKKYVGTSINFTNVNAYRLGLKDSKKPRFSKDVPQADNEYIIGIPETAKPNPRLELTSGPIKVTVDTAAGTVIESSGPVGYADPEEGLEECHGCSNYYNPEYLEPVLVANESYPLCIVCRNVPAVNKDKNSDNEKEEKQLIHIRACQEAAYEMGTSPMWINWILFEASGEDINSLQLSEQKAEIALEYANGCLIAGKLSSGEYKGL